MGQKVHPGGLRVGVIHDWKSNWYTGKKEFPQYLIEDIKIREHILKKLSHAGLSDILIRKDKQRITVDIYTARPGIVIGKSGSEVDALRKDLHKLTGKPVIPTFSGALPGFVTFSAPPPTTTNAQGAWTARLARFGFSSVCADSGERRVSATGRSFTVM